MADRIYHLHRTWYPTDRNPDQDAEYVGAFSGSARLADGRQIVSVDWSTPGEVEVTYLVPGPSPCHDLRFRRTETPTTTTKEDTMPGADA